MTTSVLARRTVASSSPRWFCRIQGVLGELADAADGHDHAAVLLDGLADWMARKGCLVRRDLR
jgi:hypothetical protein